MMFRKILLVLGALFAGNALAQGSFSVYFNGESSTTNCHVDGVSNAQLSTTGSGNLVATAATPLAFSSACGISGSAQQLTFGPGQPLKGPTTTLAAGSNVVGNFTVLPLNATACTVAIATTSGTGVATGPASGYVCGPSGAQSCAPSTPIGFNASFTNTGTGASAYQATVTCQAASGASPATLTSVATVNQSGNSGGTPAANFTFTTSNLTANFTDTSTDPGGTLSAWSWNFGDSSTTSTTPSPSHTYAAAGTYTVSLTVTDSVSSAQNTKTQQVTVSTATASCPTYASSTSGISNYTRLTGTQNVYYFGPTYNVIMTSFDSVFGAGGTTSQQVWPGKKGLSGIISLATNKYISLQFTVPAGYMEQFPSGVYGKYTLNTSGYQAPVGMTISTQCGDFSNPSVYQSTSKVISGCWVNNINSSNGALRWANSGACTLQDGATYFLNVINADISAAQPAGGGTLPSSKTANCSTACNVPLTDGPGSW